MAALPPRPISWSAASSIARRRASPRAVGESRPDAVDCAGHQGSGVGRDELPSSDSRARRPCARLAPRLHEVADEDREDGGGEYAEQGAPAETRRLDVERPLSGVGGVAPPDHDARGEQVRSGEHERDAHGDRAALPRAEVPQSEPQGAEREQREDEAVEEPEQDPGREAPAGLVGDALRPPAREEGPGDEHRRRARRTITIANVLRRRFGGRDSTAAGAGWAGVGSLTGSILPRFRARSSGCGASRSWHVGAEQQLEATPARQQLAVAGRPEARRAIERLRGEVRLLHEQAHAVPAPLLRPRGDRSDELARDAPSALLGVDPHRDQLHLAAVHARERADDADPAIVVLGDEERLREARAASAIHACHCSGRCASASSQRVPK